MTKPFIIKENQHFIGRIQEQELLRSLATKGEAAIILVYGRRRVGKTELIEQTFRNRNILKFEGVEGLSESEQILQVLKDLFQYTNNPLFLKMRIDTWGDMFDLMVPLVVKGPWTLYFEEVQWLSNYKTRFISALKKTWDNHFRHNSELLVILCGSAPSFMVNAVVKSKALYNRSQYEIPLKEFSLLETKAFLKKNRSNREMMDAYLSVGGIPEYLKRIDSESSLFLGLCKNTFVHGGFFNHEYERIFVSSLANHKHYKKIVDFLGHVKFATRDQIASYLKTESGGTLSQQLIDLELCGFIERYVPYFSEENSLLTRYCIADAYLQFYFKFIKPLRKKIDLGHFNKIPTQVLNMETYEKWLGFSFERFCRKYDYLIAKILGFSAVNYRSGVFYNRAIQQQDKGFQIDLIYDRADKVYTVCEIKYTQAKTSKKVVDEFERKLELFGRQKGYTIHKVLITAAGAEESLIKQHYFDRIITLDDFFCQ